MLVSTHPKGNDTGSTSPPWQWQCQQLREMIEVMWWRFPMDYKLSLHAAFAAPLGVPNGTPSCYSVQLAIRQHASQLRTSIAHHIQHAPRMTMQREAAYFILDQQWKQISAANREILAGFIGCNIVGNQPPLCTNYESIFCDYLYCLTTAAKNMARN